MSYKENKLNNKAFYKAKIDKDLLIALFLIIISFSIKMSLLTIILLIFSSYLIIDNFYEGDKKDSIFLKAIRYMVIIFLLVFLLSQLYLFINIGRGRLLSEPLKVNGHETMIILGTQVTKDEPGSYLKKRLDSAIPILNNNPNINVVVSGFKGKYDGNVEAVVMKDYLIRKGVENKIFIEGNSKDTIENFKLSSILIRENKLSRNIIIVTNDFHMLRSDYIARLESFNDIKHLRSNTSLSSFLTVKEFGSFNKVFLEYFLFSLF